MILHISAASSQLEVSLASFSCRVLRQSYWSDHVTVWYYTSESLSDFWILCCLWFPHTTWPPDQKHCWAGHTCMRDTPCTALRPRFWSSPQLRAWVTVLRSGRSLWVQASVWKGCGPSAWVPVSARPLCTWSLCFNRGTPATLRKEREQAILSEPSLCCCTIGSAMLFTPLICHAPGPLHLSKAPVYFVGTSFTKSQFDLVVYCMVFSWQESIPRNFLPMHFLNFLDPVLPVNLFAVLPALFFFPYI